MLRLGAVRRYTAAMLDSARYLPFPSAWRELPAMSADLLSVGDIIANVRRATWARVGFSAVMAALSMMVVPPLWSVAWCAMIVAWELAIRPLLEEKLPIGAPRGRAFGWLAVIYFIGSALTTAYSLALWVTGEQVGVVLATAWICATANHIFVYFSPNRLLTAAGLLPLFVGAIAGPLSASGFDIQAVLGIATLLLLVAAAGFFGLDRRILLGAIAKQTTARVAAEEANAAKSRFLATMSHELRTPLNAVIGYSELIAEETANRPIAEDANRIRSSARQLLGVIDTILDLSKLDAGTIELDREHIDADAVLAHLRETAPPLVSLNGNTMSIDAMPLGDAEIDLRRVHQCLMQLVSNAAKFTKDGAINIGGARTIEAGRVRLTFTVSDTGVGIHAEEHARIFEPFKQADESENRRFEGAGAGLTLVRRLAQLMGGDVSVESSPGRGSTFTLWVDGGPA